MTEEMYNAIINPICKHCKSLGIDCVGTTIKDWRYAKNCNKWEFARIKPRHDSLKLNDYIIGSDVTTEEILDTI